MVNLMEPIIELIEAHGVSGINKIPGAYEIKIDECWYLAVNGHQKEIKVKPKNLMEVMLPPFHFAVWFDGFLAGLFHPEDGVFAAGSGANEKKFIKAIKKHIKNIKV